jgi:hypothetical protein
MILFVAASARVYWLAVVLVLKEVLMLMLVIAGGALVAVALVVLLTSAKIIAPLAFGVVAIAGIIGLLMKTPPGPATTKKWQALAAGSVLLVVAIAAMTTAFTASKFVADNFDGDAINIRLGKEAEIKALMAKRDRPEWLAESRAIAMSMKKPNTPNMFDHRKSLNLTVLQSASSVPVQYEFTAADIALLEVIFAEQFGSLEDAGRVIHCHYHGVRIMLAKSTPANVADVIGRYSKTERFCDGRFRFLAEVRRQCAGINSRWGQRCAADLPRAQLAAIAAGPELDAIRDNENLNTKITELLEVMEKAQSPR